MTDAPVRYRRISVGTHVNPPPAMWVTRMPREHRARAPRSVWETTEDGERVEYLEFEGARHRFNLISADAGRPSEELVAVGRTFEEGRRGGWDPAARLVDQRLDGVDGEVILDGVTPLVTPDRALKLALIRTYNDWLAEFCSCAAARLLGIAYLPMWDVGLAVAEADRARRIGLRGVLVPSVPGRETPYSMPAERQYDDPEYEPLWSALEDLDLPMHVHVDGVPVAPELAGDTIVLMCVNKTMMCEPITVLSCSGVLARHPRLRFVAVESGVGWLAWFLPWMDLVFERHRSYTGYQLDDLPSTYVRRQVLATFIQDPIGVRLRHDIGIASIMWCNDYPHVDGFWPHSSTVLDAHFAAVAAEEREAIVAGNAMRLYGL